MSAHFPLTSPTNHHAHGGHPSLPGYYSNASSGRAEANNVQASKKRNSALSRIFPTLRTSRKNLGAGAKRANNGKGGEGDHGHGHAVAADPLIPPAVNKDWSPGDAPRLPLRNLNQALHDVGCDDRHSDPGAGSGEHQYAVPVVGPPGGHIACTACAVDSGVDYYQPGRISISEAVHRVRVAINYSCVNRLFWLSAHNCQVPTPTSRNRELEQQIRSFGAD
jgi:hypothetical protein